MDYKKIANEVLLMYKLHNAEIEFIRHNENITFKISDRLNNKNYLLRIHKPATEGLFGKQHTRVGLESEIKILQELSLNNEFKVQKPIANSLSKYVTEFYNSDLGDSCCATLLEWIDGTILSNRNYNNDKIALSLGKKVGLLHKFFSEFKPNEKFERPCYGLDRIDYAVSQLKYGVEVKIFTEYQYDLIKEVLTLVKSQLRELKRQEGSWGLIHADLLPGNIIINDEELNFIDFCLSGFGFYLFDVGSIATEFERKYRDVFLEGYSSKFDFSHKSLRYIEGLVFMDIFISYVFFIRDNNKNKWIKDHAKNVCDTLCKDFLKGKEVFYDL
ncbi:phosphotransferase enzyme family protein [Abyssisolibacter fermentans]|uniref:phosphotransferase enzyme family protein n=1 Tax=Abyssisolibacter fermentans TaxID=1766203 RepID=UPI0008366FBE|nr:aminoglycoside phosphotransferase family protein [Abyssisolibacter fermentans]